MGNQVAVLGTYLTRAALPTNLRPKRVALLDPYYSVGPQTYLGYNPKDRVPEMVRTMEESGTLFEYYHTSKTFIQPVPEITNEMAYVRVVPDYSANPTDEHMAGIHWYLTSSSYSPPAYQKKKQQGVAPSAAMSDAALRPISLCTTKCYWWVQRNGRSTEAVTDDDFNSVVRKIKKPKKPKK